MTISTGSRLGPYEVLSPLGAGGMGEVYKARDTRLERTVAVKVLPRHLSESSEVRQRFEREAKTISQLSHPHICALYDVGNQDGVEYLVMEYLEGETLADRLLKGPLPAEQTLRFGIEIADALDKAHRQGIVHRDLKPGNVMLTTSGVKLLDFGLAKALPASAGKAAGSEGLSSLITQAGNPPVTQEGTILGTFQYMAPEQLEGREADARSDIFALGAVLYEMAAGKKAFSGASQASLITAIMSSEPAPISSISPLTPPALGRAVKMCLAKDPEDRWQSARDAASELKWIAEAGSQAGVPAPLVSRRKSRERLAWTLVGACAAGMAGLAFLLLSRPHAPARMVQSSILPPENSSFAFDAGPMALSPDGQSIAFVAETAGKRMLWVRPLDGLSAQAVVGSEGAEDPFWSPDSRVLGFTAAGKLRRVNASGGEPQVLAPTLGSGAWNRDGVILFHLKPQDGLFRVAASGGSPVRVTTLETRDIFHIYPSFLPDGRHFLYLAVAKAGAASPRSGYRSEIRVGALDEKQHKVLMQVHSNVVYAAPGYLLFSRDGSLLAQAFDADRLELKGEAFSIGDQIQCFRNFGFAVFAASQNGVLAYQGGSGLSRLAWFDRGGKPLETPGGQAEYLHPRLSHDGRRVAVDVLDPQTSHSDVWIYDLATGVGTRLTFGPGDNSNPVWSSDDRRIVFASDRKDRIDLYVKEASGAGREELFSSEAGFKLPADWSMDGRFFSLHKIQPESSSGWDLWTLSLPDGKASEFLASPGIDVLGRFSPDGRWIAYQSDESGTFEVYVRPFPGPGGKWQVSNGGGREPVWRRDGKELFYIGSPGRLMAVPIRTDVAVELGSPQFLFQTRMPIIPFNKYDVTADGQRFLVNTLVEESKTIPITLVQNWTARLRKGS